MNERLTKSLWIDHGLKVLASKGHSGIKVGPMASDLGVSRGSFYWHFANLAAFEQDLIEAWENTTTEQVIDATDPAGGKPALESLINRSLADDRALDRAVRAWALQNTHVAEHLGRVDERRIGHILALLVRCGLAETLAHPRAQFLYWSYLGRPGNRVEEPDRAPLVNAMIEMLLA